MCAREERATSITVSGVNQIKNETQAHVDFYMMALFETPLRHSEARCVDVCVCVRVCGGGVWVCV